ncbi:hypothetical protein BIY21_11955 [Vibrio ponticus]|uniref:Uncharacterized protein n=1 Tax=Vibrio ponticus TaxID=265668 RepID=A0ABX3FK63_9VIBR|nr:hypothetical protein BIY21_11955 [Vibrio ponticus]
MERFATDAGKENAALQMREKSKSVELRVEKFSLSDRSRACTLGSHISKRDIFDIERSNFISSRNEKSPAISCGHI